MFKNAQLETVKAWMGDPSHKTLPLHSRIQRAIRQLILEGTLDIGKPLPASRALAKSLEVSRDTVEAAYSQLHAEGFIERRVGSGSFVSQKAKVSKRRFRTRDHRGQADSLKLSQRGEKISQRGGIREFSEPRTFAPGVPETRGFPLQTWERLERQILREYDNRALAHSPPQGLDRLRRAIADYVNLERGARANYQQILIVTSTQQALTLCSTMLMDAGDSVFIENPAYQGARKAFEAAGLNCIPIQVDANGMVVSQLEEHSLAVKAVFLTPSHQYPTGTTLSLDRRLAVIDWAQRHEAWIVEDDYDSEFHYEGKPTACVQGLDSNNRTIYIGTFTKSLFPGLRLAYMVLPTQLVEPMAAARSLMDGHSATIAQLTLSRFIEGGHFSAHVRTMRSVYMTRRNYLAKLIKEHLSDFVEVRIPVGGMQLPCIFLKDIPEDIVVKNASRAGVDVVGLSTLSAIPLFQQRGLLMGFAAYAPKEMENGIMKLAEVFKNIG